MKQKKILITGANGFIGTNLIKELIKKNKYKISALDISNSNLKPFLKKIKFIKKNIVKKLNLKQKFDVVIHLAAYNITNVGKNNLKKLIDINAFGTANILKNLNYKKLIFLSTTNVYEGNKEKKITEKTIPKPLTNYSISKYFGELFCKRELIKGKNIIILRTSNVYGLGQETKALIPIFIKNALNNKELNIFVPKNLKIQLLFVSDLINCFKKIINSKVKKGIFNIAPKKAVNIINITKKIKKLSKSKSKIIYSNNLKIINKIINSNKIKKTFKWKEIISLEDGLRKTIKYYKSN